MCFLLRGAAGVFLNRSVPEHRPLLFFFRCSLTLLFGALLMHGALQKIGVDLSWWVQCYIKIYIYLILLANITGIRYGSWTNQLTSKYHVYIAFFALPVLDSN